ncbi:MAG: HlyC/CorC family transporter [Phycisphaeraceae bacterium]|nr:HlyC/CorC family transporter [Phycisphaeraceae bacterium]
MNEPAVWITVAACLIGCCFSAVNVAIRVFSRAKLMELLEERKRVAMLDRFLDKSARYSLLTGAMRTWCNLVVLLAVLSIVQHQSRQWDQIWTYLSALAVAGVLVAVFGVAVPHSWARYKPEAILAWSMPILNILDHLMAPMLAPLHLLDPIVRRISGGSLESENDDNATDEVMSVVEEHESEGTVDEEQRDMIEAVFDLSKTTAGEIMTPRTDIQGIECTADVEEIKRVILDAGHSRIPVYGDSLDNILGILYAKDLITFLNSKDLSGFDLKSVLREALMIPATKPVRDLLQEFKAGKVHIAIVLDEYGGTAGLITIEDILEELVGDIQDEYEPGGEEPTFHRVDPRTVDVDARMYIDDLNDEMDFELPEDEDYETVGGFVFARLGHVPEVGESFTYDNVRLTVTGAERTKVLSVRVRMLDEAEADANDADRRHH